jgi:hypothetical protein
MDPEFKKEIEKLKNDVAEQMENIPKVLFKTSFDLIFELTDSNEILINVPEYNIVNHKAILSKNDSGGFTIDIENILSDMSETYDIEILIGDKIYLVPDLFISMRGTKLTRNEHNNYFSGQLIFTGQIHELKSNTDNENELYNRFIIPSKNNQLDYYINTESYRDESALHTLGRLPIEIDNCNLVLYEKKYRDKYYFIIDSNDRINPDKFSNICYSIMIGFGFLSADFIQDDAFYLASDYSDFNSIVNFSYRQLRPSIFSKGTCNPIYSNPYGYTKDETIINKIGNRINVFDSTRFSILCNKIYTQGDYATLILLILEANASSLILRPAGYSVALEKITNIIVEENKGLKPIPDKEISKKFSKRLKEVLTSLSEDINNVGNEDSLVILQKKIDSINSPTNRDKLTKPFEIYGIDLNEDDLNSIDNRNNFLHGRNINIDENTDEFSEINQISLRLNKLINKLILKHIGFSGIIINHLKHNESSFDFEINEDLFEEI